ncbi:MAG: hypothetical protein E6G05_00320 [Actinobacteria bacterium]|nr:MAG: hypothetical protein E6G05_00320 [Actinomycetota bacterium]
MHADPHHHHHHDAAADHQRATTHYLHLDPDLHLQHSQHPEHNSHDVVHHEQSVEPADDHLADAVAEAEFELRL